MNRSLVVSFLITLLLAASVCAQEPVKDTDENPISVREKYFIQPVNTTAGGLVPAAIKILPFCPLGITQSLPTQPGLPVSFAYTFLTMDGTVNTTLDVNIMFRSDRWLCNEFSKLWEVGNSSSASKEPAILVGGKRESRNSWFKIEKAGEGTTTYKLTSLNGTVGSIPGPYFGIPQLVLTSDNAKTVFVKFRKVDDVTTATDSTSWAEKLGLKMFPNY